MMTKEIDENKRAAIKVILKQYVLRDRELRRQEQESDRESLRIKQQRHKQRKKELSELANVKQQIIRQSNIFQSLQAQKIRVFDHLKSLIHDSHVVVDIADLAKLYELGLAVTCPDPSTTTSSIATQSSPTYITPRAVVSTTTTQCRIQPSQSVTQTSGKRVRTPSPPIGRHPYALKQRSPGPHTFQKIDENRHHDYNRAYVWSKPNTQNTGYGSFYPPSHSTAYTVSAVPIHVPTASYSYAPLNRDPHESIHKPQPTNQPHVYRSAVPQQPYLAVEHPKSSHIYHPDDKYYITVRPSSTHIHGGSMPMQQQPSQSMKLSNIPTGYPVRSSVIPSIQIQPATSHSSHSQQPHQPPSHIQIQGPSSRQPMMSHLQSQHIQIQASSLPHGQYHQQSQMHGLQPHHMQQTVHLQSQHMTSAPSQSVQQSSQQQQQSTRIISSPHQPHSHLSQSPHQVQQQQHIIQSQSHGGSGGHQSSSTHLVHQVRSSNQPVVSQPHNSQTAISQHQQISHSGQYQQQITHIQPHHAQQQPHIISTHHPPPHQGPQPPLIRAPPHQHIQMRAHLQPGMPHQSVPQQHNSIQQSHTYPMQPHLKMSNTHIPPPLHSIPSASHHGSKIVQSSHMSPSQHHQQPSYPPASKQQQSVMHQQSSTPQHQSIPQSYQSAQQVQSSQQSQTMMQIHHQNLNLQSQQQQHHSEQQQIQNQRRSPSVPSVVTQSSVIRNFNSQQ